MRRHDGKVSVMTECQCPRCFLPSNAGFLGWVGARATERAVVQRVAQFKRASWSTYIGRGAANQVAARLVDKHKNEILHTPAATVCVHQQYRGCRGQGCVGTTARYPGWLETKGSSINEVNVPAAEVKKRDVAHIFLEWERYSKGFDQQVRLENITAENYAV